ncbi:MAG TPA: chloride channel protein [Polyangiaceae bacterium]|jgi:CIC family chloride channel protein
MAWNTRFVGARGPRAAARGLAGVVRGLAQQGSRSPIAFQLLGRMLLHTALVGVAAGLAGSLFFAGVELVQRLVLESSAGYVPLRAAGERVTSGEVQAPFRGWILWLLPAVGALVAGLVSSLAPETRSGGTDAIIEAFHENKGNVRRRVPLVKAIVSIFTLGFGGSGGREGPTMQIGGAIGSIVGRYLRVGDRERRILLVAGTAAGMAAVFRTPLGAALLAVEVLHRDDFEADALIPSVLASVIAYSVFISFFGEATLFAHATKYPLVLAHLPLYGLLAVATSFVAVVFLKALRTVQRVSSSARLPDWLKPAVGGLVLGGGTTLALVVVGPHVVGPARGLGLLGGGYGEAQVAITGSTWLPEGWHGVELLVLLGCAKIVATSLTVGSGGSAGDFGPSLVLGGVFGGAFGRACQLLLHDPRIDPGAFALVGMGTLYGGLAHVPIASLVMTCELAGSYDLLVPLMLAEGIAFVALRNRSLYHAQRATKRDSPAHRGELVFDVLREVPVRDVLARDRPYVTFDPETSGDVIVERIAGSAWQDAFPVLARDRTLVGVVSSDVLRTLTAEPTLAPMTIAHDLMMPPIAIAESDNLHSALEAILSHGLREVPVVDLKGRIVGFVDEAEINRAYRDAVGREDDS